MRPVGKQVFIIFSALNLRTKKMKRKLRMKNGNRKKKKWNEQPLYVDLKFAGHPGKAK